VSTIDKAVYGCPISVNSLIDTLKVLEKVGRFLRDLNYAVFYSIEAKFFEIREEENILEIENKSCFEISTQQVVLNLLDSYAE
jgi:hypothetical protein